MSPAISQERGQETPIASISKPTDASKGAGMRIVHAVAWKGAATWATQLITWGYMIVVARVLSPSDYGLIAMAGVPLGFLTVASEFGLNSAVVMMPDLTSYQIAQLNTVAVICGVMLFALTCFGAYPLGQFFRAPNLPMVVVAMSLTLVITSFKIVPAGLLHREFRFKLLAHIQTAEAVAYGLAAVIILLLGGGYWSLVMASITSVTVSTLLVLHSRRHAFAWPKLESVQRSVVFSAQILGRRLAWYCNSSADLAIAGRVLGAGALGSYSIARNIALQPLQKLTDLVTGVIPAYFSKAQNDPAALREYVVILSQALSLLMLPATLGLALVAHDLVAVAFGPKWINAVAPLQLLAVWAAARSITGFLAPLLNVTGQSRFVMWIHILAALYFTGAFYIGSRWGLVGIAVMWPLLYPLLAMPLYLRAFKQINLRWRSYWAAVRPAVTASALMVVCVIAFKEALPPSTPIYWRLAGQIVTGAGAYGLALSALHRGDLRRAYNLIRSAS
jgi:O-antigen/teichoic acid export membrane protein